ncbi:hypothetical protein IPJ72_01195 [Candidatus Peregrinibacteria bacterium]|nr:MAG: hypothetical protein IPJ72_01195 [Candidatus Peregrinibacteria bacterium]
MKLIISLFLVFALLTGCQPSGWFGGSSSDENSITGDVALKVGEFYDIEGVYRVIIGDIQDSRCPSDVNCIVAGQARVAVLVMALDTQETTTFSLSTDAMGEQGDRAQFGPYTLVLTNLLPYPISTQSVSSKDYSVHFHLFKSHES